MNKTETIWLRPPHGQGEPQEVEATPAVLVPLLVAGWSQCEPPEAKPEVKNVDN
jgi:hypothetical protein